MRARIELLPARIWTVEELERDRLHAIEDFKRARVDEPLEAYLRTFDSASRSLQELLDRSGDLMDLSTSIERLLDEPALAEGVRYLAGPPISLDDLKTIVDASSLSASALRRDSGLVRRFAATIRVGLDCRRFPWVEAGRPPTQSEREAAVLATAALIATQRHATSRRNEGKRQQEALVRSELVRAGLTEVPRREIATILRAPAPGEFCLEAVLGRRKADLIVRLWDGRVMPIECKVSNSSTNSVK